MPLWAEHGGECCGMSHIHNIGGSHTLRYIDQRLGQFPYHHCVEIVLTDSQIKESKALMKGIKQRGFKLVSRFLNDNSGNYCNVLHRYPLSGKGSGKKNSPWHKV